MQDNLAVPTCFAGDLDRAFRMQERESRLGDKLFTR